MNILTFDIEEWYLEKTLHGNRPERYKLFDNHLSTVLDTLDQCNHKGTFFCVGGLAREFPEVVRRIAERGHEIGCHSDRHTWLNKMTPEVCREDTRTAVDSIEQCLGEKIRSYRAPAFSIGASNKWAFEILAECGIENDASVFPAVRDFGGFAEFGRKTPSVIKYNGIEIKEFPICTTKIFGKEFAYSGGGYFRLFPYWFMSREMDKCDYTMTYFHIADLLKERGRIESKEAFEAYYKTKGTLFKRYSRYLKSNIGKGNSLKKLIRLLQAKEFVNLKQASETYNWSEMPIIEL